MTTWLLLSACTLRAPVAGSDSGDTGEAPASDIEEADVGEPGAALVTTVNGTFTEGWLASVDLEDASVDDGLLQTTGDPQLTVLGDRVLVLDRFAGGLARVFDPADWSAPLAEFAVDGDPYAAASCGDALFISRYSAGAVSVVDPETGAALGEIDLAGGEGWRPAGLLAVGETLYVALHAVDEDTWTPADGAVAAVDCGARALSGLWEAPGPLPALYPPLEGRAAPLVRAGAYDLKGGIYALEAGRFEPLLLEAEWGLGVADLALRGARGVALTYDAEWRYAVSCLDAGERWSLAEIQGVRSQLVDVAISPGGLAWVAARAALDDPETPAGLLVFDVESCSPITGADWVSTDLPPWRVAFLPGSR